PAAGIVLEHILAGLRRFGGMYPGILELEVFICPGLNDTEREVDDLGEFFRQLPGLDAVYLNAAVRNPVDTSVLPAGPDLLDSIRHRLNLQIPVSTAFDHSPLPKRTTSKRSPTGQEILDLLKRHPCTLEQLYRVFGGELAQLTSTTTQLLESGTAEKRPDGTFAPLSSSSKG
ncbi:MAG TPA: hypothetical protein PKM25_15340, partial [Candidatus Ozemobacteraceae bacterium]|nr:hypothetical protein [Candidatus Ozemobacteraceae bacterium]